MNEPSFANGVPGFEPERRQIGQDISMPHLVFALIGFVIPLFIYANSRPSGCSGTLTACMSNCKNIATALEMYSSDHGGRYPATLEQLIPGNYLKKIPTCPAAGRATYGDYVISAKQGYFQFTCIGNKHARPYSPHYSSVSGLRDHPVSEEFAIGIPGLEPEERQFDFGLLALHVLAALAGLVGPFYVYACTQPCRNYGQLTACKSNCKNIATALEMYASDNGGHYPVKLRELMPGNYLGKLPTCPTAGRTTYTDYQCVQTPDSFSFSCVGNNHARAYTGFSTSSTNFPQYSAESGLLDHP